MGPCESISKLGKLGHWNTLNKVLKLGGGGGERCEEIQRTRNDWFAANLPYGLHHGEEGPLYIITKGVVGEPRVLPYTNSFPVAYYPTHALMKQSRS